MIESGANPVVTLSMIGALTIVAMLAKSGLARVGLPSLIGFLVLGLLIRVADDRWGLFIQADMEILVFFGKVGLVTLLFRVGLESHLAGLLSQLKRASLIWMANALVSAASGYTVAFYLLNLGITTSLVVATAFTATSVGISVAVWQEKKALQSPNGELLVDIAVLDDISAVILMALLFAMLPQLNAGGLASIDSAAVVWVQTGLFLLKLIGFGGFCFLFSVWVEKPATALLRRLEPTPDPMLTVVGIGFMIAAMAEWLGFSMAIGAFFAGLIFSRDRETVKMESSFMPIYELFSPFFFIFIGLQMNPAALGAALKPGAILALAAICAKLVANGLPVWLMRGRRAGILIGASMIPRAEITMVIMQRGHAMDGTVVSSRLYNAMILVAALTCILAPIGVRCLLRRWPGETQ
jgi:Kef-type K+ transport system membrane component KefB